MAPVTDGPTSRSAVQDAFTVFSYSTDLADCIISRSEGRSGFYVHPNSCYYSLESGPVGFVHSDVALNVP